MSCAEEVAAELPAELAAAAAEVTASIAAFMAWFSELDSGDVTIEETEAVEARLGDANRALSRLTGRHDALVHYTRKALLEAGAPGWKTEGGPIFCAREPESVADWLV
jgi:hypothetical protein